MSAEPVFMISDTLRHGSLRTIGSADSAAAAAATALVERFLKAGRFAEAARIGILGHRWRSASQALRCAVGRGGISFTDLFTRELESISFRDALQDPFLSVAVALGGHDRIIDSSRDLLLAVGVTDSDRVGEFDENDVVAPDTTPAEAEFERELWRRAIALVASRALGDWRALAKATNAAIKHIAATPKPVLARAGALHSFVAAQIELASAFLGEREYIATEKHVRFATALIGADSSWVLGSVALAAAIRGQMVEAEAVLETLGHGDTETDPQSMSTEHLMAIAFHALENRDERALRKTLDDLGHSAVHDSALAEISTVLEARYSYMRGERARYFDSMRIATNDAGLPWARAEAIAFRIERCLEDGLMAQARVTIDDVQSTPFARWHVVRLALAKSRFAQNQVDAAQKIAESVWVAASVSPRHHARALAIGAVCARQSGNAAEAEELLQSMHAFSARGGLQEPYDDLTAEMAAPRDAEGSRIRPGLPAPHQPLELTRRELAVLQALSDLNSADEIALMLHVSKNTVKTQLRHIYRKFGVHSREQALRVAIDGGLL